MQSTPRSASARAKKKQKTPQSKMFANIAIIGLSGLLTAGIGAAVVQEQQAKASGAEAVSTYTPSATENRPILSVIGDSYTGGSNEGGDQDENWVPKSVKLINADGADVKFTSTGIGGSGYVSPGPTDQVFGDVVSKTVVQDSDVVLFFGSINDMDQPLEKIGDAASKAYAAAKKKAPDATLVVAGPAWMEPGTPEKLDEINQLLEVRAEEAGAVWIDPLEERWFEDEPNLIGKDGVHPTDEGHTYMAEKFASRLGPLFE